MRGQTPFINKLTICIHHNGPNPVWTNWEKAAHSASKKRGTLPCPFPHSSKTNFAYLSSARRSFATGNLPPFQSRVHIPQRYVAYVRQEQDYSYCAGAAFHLLLCAFNTPAHHTMLNYLALFKSQPVHQFGDSLGTKQSHKVILK